LVREKHKIHTKTKLLGTFLYDNMISPGRRKVSGFLVALTYSHHPTWEPQTYGTRENDYYTIAIIIIYYIVLHWYILRGRMDIEYARRVVPRVEGDDVPLSSAQGFLDGR